MKKLRRDHIVTRFSAAAPPTFPGPQCRWAGSLSARFLPAFSGCCHSLDFVLQYICTFSSGTYFLWPDSQVSVKSKRFLVLRQNAFRIPRIAMAAESGVGSRVPRHLRPLQQSREPSALLTTQAPHYYTIPRRAASPPPAVELCPPHWRLPAKQSKRTKFKNLILKLSTGSATATEMAFAKSQPYAPRIKHPDDRITARGANPRTGIVSPSAGYRSPRTPESPGDALDLYENEPTPPTPTPEKRLAIPRAAQGREVSTGSMYRWRAGADGWISETVLVAASPRDTDATAGADMLAKKSRVASNGGHPGMLFTPATALYRNPLLDCKSARPVNFGPDKIARKTCDGSVLAPTPRQAGTGSASTSHVAHISGRRQFSSGSLTGSRQPDASQTGAPDKPSYEMPVLTSATFVPFLSPHTPQGRSAKIQRTMLNTVHKLDAYRASKPKEHRSVIQRKPVGGHGTATAQDNMPLHSCVGDKLQTTSGDPNLLPRVRLGHSDLAAVSLLRTARDLETEPRRCSFGCDQGADTGLCKQTRRASNLAATSSRPSLFQPSANGQRQASFANAGQQQEQSSPVDIARTLVLDIVKQFRSPDMNALAYLSAPGASPQQKLDATTELLYLLMLVAACMAAIAVILRVYAAVLLLAEALFFPITVSCRVLRWLSS
jgi:hypothetical protein